MNALKKAAVCLVLAFSFIFTCIGYAALTDELKIFGRVDVDISQGLFITSISTSSTANIDEQTVSFISQTTTVDSMIDRSNSGAGTVTYEITVLNNTSRTYAYRGLYYQESLDGYNGNSYVSESNGNNVMGITTSFPDGSTVESGQTLTFYATYTVGRRMNAYTDWKTLVNFQFGINVDSVEEAREAIAEKFENVLNTSSTYEELADKIDDKYDGTWWKANFIGNVAGSTGEDSTTISTLFAGQLSMVIDGVEQPVTVLIKREDVDGNENTGDDYTATYGNSSTSGTGCEYTIYMTTDPLRTAGGNAEVYVMVYTCNKDESGNPGEWYLIGESYRGYAPIVGYEGESSGNTGSFVTDDWRSYAATYSPSENYSYTVNRGQTIKDIIQATDPSAVTAMQSMLDEAYSILEENKYAGTGMIELERVYYEMGDIYTIGTDGKPTINETVRSRLIPYIEKLEQALKAFVLSELEALAKEALNILNSTEGEEADREALRVAYNNAKNAGLFTDTGGTVVVNDDASYNNLKLYVSSLVSALDVFEQAYA